MIGICRLWRSESELQVSHIVPKFVFSWQKETAASPIRHSKQPNVRIQDGEKLYFLCANCENLFSRWENLFSQNIFRPLQEEHLEKRHFQYGEWCLKFAVSVSWRALAYAQEKGIDQISTEQSQNVDEALKTWREYLLSERKSPAPFHQHLLPLSIIENKSNINLSPFINRYFLRAIDLDIAHSSSRMFTYVKMGKIILFGLVQEKHRELWKSTKIVVSRGILSIGNIKYVIPVGLDHYLSERAAKAASIFSSMSPNQQEKVLKYTHEHEDKIVQSEIFTAMKRDFELFGDDAATHE